MLCAPVSEQPRFIDASNDGTKDVAGAGGDTAGEAWTEHKGERRLIANARTATDSCPLPRVMCPQYSTALLVLTYLLNLLFLQSARGRSCSAPSASRLSACSATAGKQPECRSPSCLHRDSCRLTRVIRRQYMQRSFA